MGYKPIITDSDKQDELQTEIKQLRESLKIADADAERLATEYIKVLSEIGGVWWEDPFERSSALIAHKNRLERK